MKKKKSEDLLDKAIEREFNGAYKEGVSDEERKARLDSMNQMYRTKVERESADEQKKSNRCNILVKALSTLAMLGFSIFTFREGLKFEETGHMTSGVFRENRNFVSRIFQRNDR